YKVVDQCNNALTGETITYTGSDQTAPVGTAPAGVSGVDLCAADAISTYTFNAATVAGNYSDNCLGTVTAVPTDTTFVNDDCGWTLTYTYKVVDQCNNALTGETITYTGSDQTAPTLINLPQQELTIDCSVGIPDTANVSATDNCDTEVLITFSETVNVIDGCGTITRTWVAEDDCGNDVSFTQTITVVDNLPPTFTAPNDTIVYADASCSFDTTEVNIGTITNIWDNCDNSPEVHVTKDDCFGTNDPTTLNAGQNGVSFYFDITGLDNLEANDIKHLNLDFVTNQGKGKAEFWLVNPAGQAIMLVGPFCNEPNCLADDDPEKDNFIPTFYNSGYTQWNNSDTIPEGEGNFTPYGGTNTESLSLMGVSEDSVKTTFDEFSGTPMNGTWYIWARKQANANGDLKFNSVCLTPALEGCENNSIVVRKWTVTDHCGNNTTGQQVIQMVDTTGPEIIIPADATVDCDAVPPVPIVIATDNCGGSFPVSFVADTIYDKGCIDQYTITRTWSATDNCDNTTTKTQTITIENCCNETVYAGEDITVCEGANINLLATAVTEATSYVWEGPNNYSETGMEPAPFSATTDNEGKYVVTVYYGCECVATDTVEVFINPVILTSSNETACDSFTWDGTTYYETGAYEKTYNSVTGCDSIHTLNLTIRKTTFETLTEDVCDSLVVNGVKYTETGVYEQTLTNEALCDSILTIDLTIR
ncbi:hypothetical protein OU798_01315, partial [Prolixibacteraceae bacterium Z1-6]|nr:hypothetical protein [Prolixibacteraceae bacterium Z1-6]